MIALPANQNSERSGKGGKFPNLKKRIYILLQKVIPKQLYNDVIITFYITYYIITLIPSNL